MVLEKYSQIISTKWPGRAYRIGGDEFILTAKRLSPGQGRDRTLTIENNGFILQGTFLDNHDLIMK